MRFFSAVFRLTSIYLQVLKYKGEGTKFLPDVMVSARECHESRDL